MIGTYSDFHSHLFPGVDDGSRTVEDALEGIGRMIEAGIHRIITTPHFAASITRDEAEFNRVMNQMDEAWATVWKAASKEYPALDFRRGQEIMLDVPDPDLSDPRLHLGGTQFVLVEWPRLHIPPGTVEVIERLAAAGHVPVIAHPERYIGVDKELRILRSWRDAGALFQGNFGSIVGRYGPAARALILRMLEEGQLDYLSSDFHGRPEYTLYLDEGKEALIRMQGGQQLDVLASSNPARLFKGENPFPASPLRLERSLLRKFQDWMHG